MYTYITKMTLIYLLLLFTNIFVRMLPKPIYKYKNPPINPDKDRCNTEYISSKSKLRTSVSIKNKLTKGLKSYDEIKEAYKKPCEGHHFKTQQNEFNFEPQFSGQKKERSKSRSLKKFISDQSDFSEHKQNKIKQFRTEMTRAEAQQCSNRPSIDKRSKKLCSMTKYDQQNIVERLSKKKIIVDTRDNEDLFSPKILPKSKSLKRNKNIAQLLHEDAERRHQKMNFIQNQRGMKECLSPKINPNTNRLVCKKIYTEFSELIPENEEKIPIVMAWTVIGELFNIDLNPADDSRQANLCIQMLNYLCSDGQEIVDRQKLWEFIQIIIFKDCCSNSHFADSIEDIINNFGHLYTNRVAKPKTNRSPPPNSFTPQTLRSSEKYAQKFREKMFEAAKAYIETENTNMNMKESVRLEDMFLIDSHMKRASLQKKKMEKDEAELKNCTFKPKINKKISNTNYLPPKVRSTSNTLQQSKISSNSKTIYGTFKSADSLSQSLVFNCNSTLKSSKCLTNYQTKPFNSVKKGRQQSLDRCQAVKSNTNNENCKQTTVEVKNVEKSIMRIALGRKNRQYENSMKARGYPNQQNWTEYTQKEKKAVEKEHTKFKGYNYYKKITLR